MEIGIKRIYDPPEKDDGFRVLVDRLWPRGLSKEKAALDLWEKDLAPTTALRKWFNHEGPRFDEFRSRYLKELDSRQDAVANLIKKAGNRTVTLLFSARDRSHNHAVVLKEYLSRL